ncbi:MAG TPA: glycosyltransferase family 4 protein [Phycisphaerae bacterium]|nr:glycosyltransferase family 4 protein [Phycisphaerae bacterium]
MSADNATLRVGEPAVAYLLQVFPKYSETFIVNEILEHQNQGRPVRVLSLRLPREGRFHGCLKDLESASEYIPESFWDSPAKIREAAWTVMKHSASGLPRIIRRWGAGDVTFRDLWQAMLVRRWAARRNVRHVHCHFGGFAATVAALSRMIGGPTFSVTLHAHEIFRESVNRRLLRRIIELSAFCVTVSQFNARHLEQHVGADPAKIRVLYNGIPLDRFTFHTGSREPGTILSVGRLIEKKGFVYLVRACRLLADKGLLKRCEIVGEGREEDRLRKEIKRLDLGSFVQLTGPWPQERVAAALSRCAAFALPCIRAADGNMDALPTVLLEAMAAGCPVVSTRLSGIPEIVDDGRSGLLVEPNDETALATTLETVLKDASRAQVIAEAGRRRVEELFDVRKSVATLGEWQHRAAGPTRDCRAALPSHAEAVLVTEQAR